MAKHVCPWWLGYLLASPVRRWLGQDAAKILAPYVREGMMVFEPGPGMGFFTLELARLIGPSGKVIALATEGDEEIKEDADHVLYIPVAPDELSPILEIVPLQLLAYHIAVRRGCDVDQPRNLAKSVTVE